MPDTVTAEKRSAIMRAVRSRGNRSTEMAVEAVLRRAHIRGWTKHPTDVLGKPDFYFAEKRLAVFVDGCFWHACPKCARNIPGKHRSFWKDKLGKNRRRDIGLRRKLNALGIGTLRIWEHQLKSARWLARLQSRIDSRLPVASTRRAGKSAPNSRKETA
jgi:DNA mismatch endonuclease (patch repair protein)